MVTVRAANGENTERRTRLDPTLRMETNTTTHPNKTINTLQQPERDHAKTAGYYEPITVILDHLALNPKL